MEATMEAKPVFEMLGAVFIPVILGIVFGMMYRSQSSRTWVSALHHPAMTPPHYMMGPLFVVLLGLAGYNFCFLF